MIKCEYPNCDHKAYFFMGWENKNGKHFGLVCATHDKDLGRENLLKYGMSIEECILFEHYLKETVDLESCLDFPEWTKQRGKTCTQPTPSRRPSYKGTASITLLGLPPGTQNTLRRNNIITIEELTKTSTPELLKMRMMGATRIHEIQRKLKEFTDDK